MTRMLSLDEVRAITGYSRSSVYRQAKAGNLPKPVKLSVLTNGWFSDEIDAWLESKRAERDAQVMITKPKRGPGRPRKNPWLAPAA